jgi:hypothetical protein
LKYSEQSLGTFLCEYPSSVSMVYTVTEKYTRFTSKGDPCLRRVLGDAPRDGFDTLDNIKMGLDRNRPKLRALIDLQNPCRALRRLSRNRPPECLPHYRSASHHLPFGIPTFRPVEITGTADSASCTLLGIESPPPPHQHPRPFLARVASQPHFRGPLTTLPSDQPPLIATPPIPTSVRDGSSDPRASSAPIPKVTKKSKRRIDLRPY